MVLTKVLVTGANAGIGKECARQLALLEGMQKVYLGCRSLAKAEEAKADLEKTTGKTNGMFEIVIVDVSSLASVKDAVGKLPAEAMDGLVLNAGGQGGKDFASLTEEGVTNIMAANVLGHALLVDLLLEQKKLVGTVIFAGTEAARGVPPLPRPKIQTGSLEEFVSICDGSFSKQKTFEGMYGPVKLLGALWISSMARKHPDMRFITMSPGGTSGTNVSNDMAFVMKMMMKMTPLMSLFGMAHGVETAAKRYVDALTKDDTYKSGVFYASKKATSGPVCDQAELFSVFSNEEYQDNAFAAIHKFL